MNFIKLAFRRWLEIPDPTEVPWGTVRTGPDSSEVEPLLATIFNHNDAIDELVTTHTEELLKQRETLKQFAQLMTLFEVKDIPKPEGFDERKAAEDAK